MFAAHRTYRKFLDQRFSPKSENEQAARLKELAESGARSMPRNKDEMRRLVERETNPAGIGDQVPDLTKPGARQQTHRLLGLELGHVETEQLLPAEHCGCHHQ